MVRGNPKEPLSFSSLSLMHSGSPYSPDIGHSGFIPPTVCHGCGSEQNVADCAHGSTRPGKRQARVSQGLHCSQHLKWLQKDFGNVLQENALGLEKFRVRRPGNCLAQPCSDPCPFRSLLIVSP